LNISVDLKLPSGWGTRNSSDPDTIFFQLISEHRASIDEIDIFTDDSRVLDEDNKCWVGCAVFIPRLDIIHKLKLNDMTSSYMAEVYAIDKILDLCKIHGLR